MIYGNRWALASLRQGDTGRPHYSAEPLALQVTQMAGRGRSAHHIPSPSPMASGHLPDKIGPHLPQVLPSHLPHKASTLTLQPQASSGFPKSEQLLPHLRESSPPGGEGGLHRRSKEPWGQCLRLTRMDTNTGRPSLGQGQGQNNAPEDVHILVSDPVHR